MVGDDSAGTGATGKTAEEVRLQRLGDVLAHLEKFSLGAAGTQGKRRQQQGAGVVRVAPATRKVGLGRRNPVETVYPEQQSPCDSSKAAAVFTLSSAFVNQS